MAEFPALFEYFSPTGADLLALALVGIVAFEFFLLGMLVGGGIADEEQVANQNYVSEYDCNGVDTSNPC